MRQTLALLAALLALMFTAAAAQANTTASDTSLVTAQVKAEIAIVASDASPMTLSHFNAAETLISVDVTSTYPDWTVSIVDGQADGATGPAQGHGHGKQNPGYFNRKQGNGPSSLKMPLKAAVDGSNLHPVNGSKRGIFSGAFNESHQVRIQQHLKHGTGDDDGVLSGDSYELVLAFSAVAN